MRVSVAYYIRVSRLMGYTLAALAGTTLTDNTAFQITPHCIIAQTCELLLQSSAILR